MNLTVSDISQAYPDLTPEEQQVLLNIRQRKEELLHEIYQLKEELSDVSTEIEAMDTEEGAKLKVRGYFLLILIKQNCPMLLLFICSSHI